MLMTGFNNYPQTGMYGTGNYPASAQMYGNNIIYGVNWVQGEAGAKASVNPPPGVPLILLDSEQQTFYIKTTDNNYVPQPLQIYDYKKREVQQRMSSEEESGYIEELKKMYGELSEKYDHLEKMIDDLTK